MSASTCTPVNITRDGALFYATWSHPIYGFVDATGLSEQMALSNIEPKIREARAAHFRRRAMVMMAEKAARNEIAEQILRRDRARELAV